MKNYVVEGKLSAAITHNVQAETEQDALDNFIEQHSEEILDRLTEQGIKLEDGGVHIIQILGAFLDMTSISIREAEPVEEAKIERKKSLTRGE